MMVLSRRFRDAVKLHGEPAYRLAVRADFHPTTLSKLLHGAVRVRPGDPRVIAVGRQLGLDADECFEVQRRAEPGTPTPEREPHTQTR